MTTGKRILVIDDDDSIREFVEMALQDEGYEVVSVAHGEAALAAVAEARPSLILLDMRMPVMTGWDFAQAYRATPGPHVPIIVVTAAHDPEVRAAQIHADDFLAKPFDIDDLLQVVERYTAGT